MKGLWGDDVRVRVSAGYTVTLSIRSPGGGGNFEELTPKKARRLARRLKKAAKAAEEGTA